MKKMSQKNRRQQGVALLFALGILSLLMILGLAFVTNSVIARKVAHNTGSRSQAKMLAQSAISRAAISIMVYQYQAENPAGTNAKFWPTSFSQIYSFAEYDDAGKETAGGSVKFDDQLTGADSLLQPPSGFSYNAKNSKANWVMVYDQDDVDQRRIIGRIAYQVLPSASPSRLFLKKVLNGYNTSGSSYGVVPNQNRWGADSAELYFNSSEVLNDWAGWLKNDGGAVIPFGGETFTDFYNLNFFAASDANLTQKKDWLEYWFVDGQLPSEKEAYLYTNANGGGSRYLYRFNLGRDGGAEWEARFGLTNADDGNRVKLLTALFHDNKDFVTSDDKAPNTTGLPFLRRLTDTKGSFDSIEARRYQIAANLNDYSDNDGENKMIPTAGRLNGGTPVNVFAKDWASLVTQDSTTWPEFTGNEESAYINEIALGVKVEPTMEAGKGLFSGVKVNPQVTLTPELIAELIDIYRTNPTKKSYEVATELKSLSVTMKAVLDADVSWKIINPDGSTSFFDKKLTDLTEEFSPFTLAAPLTATIDGYSSANYQNGYLLSGVSLAPLTAQKVDFSEKLRTEKTLVPTEAQDLKVEIKGIRFEITGFTYDFGALALIDVEDAANQYGVDFVRWFNPTTLPSLTLNLFANDTNVVSGKPAEEGWLLPLADNSPELRFEANSNYFFLGGLEVRDPRQNLNAKGDATEVSGSDWLMAPKLVNSKALSTGSETLPSFNTALAADLNGRLTGGKVNTVSNPASPAGYADASKIDQETATNPAGRTISTAYIRNAPMKSLWELGAIHRGAAWETINLKKAGSPGSSDSVKPSDFASEADLNSSTGTSYAGGDGALLEQAMIGADAYCNGKVDINMLCASKSLNPDDTFPDDWRKDMARALFQKIRLGQRLWNFGETDSTAGEEVTAEKINASYLLSAFDTTQDRPFKSRTQFLDWGAKNATYKYLNGFGLQNQGFSFNDDAAQEELIGKTINLMTANGGLSNTIQIVIVAQSVLDIAGENVTRFDQDGEPVMKSLCKRGVFDYDEDKEVYFDEISGEVKILATLDRNPMTGRMILRKIEYID